jgi:hypothetical protein
MEMRGILSDTSEPDVRVILWEDTGSNFLLKKNAKKLREKENNERRNSATCQTPASSASEWRVDEPRSGLEAKDWAREMEAEDARPRRESDLAESTH